MNKKNIILSAFILVALVQLFVPAKMILDSENVLKEGTEYKFKTAPIDPSDPFRGKYITLNYSENTVDISSEQDWKVGEIIYVFISTDMAGFAKIKSVTKEKPTSHNDFVKATVSFVTDDNSNKLTINYPFDRYYMEESKAYDAELTYTQSLQDANQVAYALVSIKDGEAVLKDVFVDGTSIREIVKKNQEGKK